MMPRDAAARAETDPDMAATPDGAAAAAARAEVTPRPRPKAKVARGVGRVFAIVAFVEAGTWTGLLLGMYLKYVTQTTELGVQIFGQLHGYAFLTYVAVTIVAAIRLRWPWYAIIAALVAAIPPLTTILVEVWLRRTGRLVRTAVAPASDPTPQR